MARRVLLHIGQPKSGTTYLQSIAWANRKQLRDGANLLLPGRGHREHLWAALAVQERPNLVRRHRDAPHAWERVCAATEQWPGDVLITHEFFCGATDGQAQRAVAALQPAEVHLIVTTRDLMGLVTSGLQERVKNGYSGPIDTISEVPGSGSEFGWLTWDLAGILRRWSPWVDDSHVHILPMPTGAADPLAHWRQYAKVLGIDPGDYEAPARPENVSLGAVQLELLHRLNAHLTDFKAPRDRGDWIRGFLAEAMLSRQLTQSRMACPPDLVDEIMRRSEAALDMLGQHKFDVVGDIETLRVDPQRWQGRPLEEIDPEEVIDSAMALIVDMLREIRRGLASPLASRNEG